MLNMYFPVLFCDCVMIKNMLNVYKKCIAAAHNLPGKKRGKGKLHVIQDTFDCLQKADHIPDDPKGLFSMFTTI